MRLTASLEIHSTIPLFHSLTPTLHHSITFPLFHFSTRNVASFGTPLSFRLGAEYPATFLGWAFKMKSDRRKSFDMSKYSPPGDIQRIGNLLHLDSVI